MNQKLTLIFLKFLKNGQINIKANLFPLNLIHGYDHKLIYNIDRVCTFLCNDDPNPCFCALMISSSEQSNIFFTNTQ